MRTTRVEGAGTAPIGIALRAIAAWLAYPSVIALVIGLYAASLALGMPAAIAAYLGAAIGAASIFALERWFPYRRDWSGRISDLKIDLPYLALVQIALPVLLAVTISALIVDRGLAAGNLASLWPHDWPIAAQCLLLLMLASLLRYWVHVACHRIPMLWRLHAAHHSSTRLYWLNVARMHPLEKTLQYLIEGLPFILLGVGGEVIGFYFVVFAVNGFFQHANVDLRFGWLNYVVSSPELHRWHHSQQLKESNSNYCNTLIIWDLLFGTRYLPHGREVGALGVAGTPYPDSFLAQLGEPFKGVASRLRRWLLGACLRSMHATRCRALLAKTQAPETAQAKVLRRILRANRNTRFGRRHGFGEMRSYRDFSAQVPVQTYESLRPYIERQRAAGTPELTADPPIFYTRTSATTAAPKDLPYTRRALKAYVAGQRAFAAFQFAAAPKAYGGRMLGIVGAAVEGHFDNGLPFGAASGYFYRHIPRLAQASYVVPWQVFDIEDCELKYLLIARLAAAERNITHLASANPSTFLKLESVIATHRREILADVLAESFSRLAELDADLRRILAPRLRSSEARKRELEQILAVPAPSLRELWPELELVTTWTGGSCGIALEAVRRRLPAGARIADPGYLASEFRGTLTVDLERNLSVPMIDESFYEFVAREDWESGRPSFLGLSELETGRDYYIIVTTASGLYRYFINDIVRVNGWVNETPSLAFLRKGRGTTNITGEKLCEAQVIEAVGDCLADTANIASFYLMLCRPDAARYELLLQLAEPASAGSAKRLGERLDDALAARNLEYRGKRASGRLKPPRVVLMSTQFADAYRRHCVGRGQRESQFKPAVLQYADELGFDYAPLVAAPQRARAAASRAA